MFVFYHNDLKCCCCHSDKENEGVGIHVCVKFPTFPFEILKFEIFFENISIAWRGSKYSLKNG